MESGFLLVLPKQKRIKIEIVNKKVISIVWQMSG